MRGTIDQTLENILQPMPGDLRRDRCPEGWKPMEDIRTEAERLLDERTQKSIREAYREQRTRRARKRIPAEFLLPLDRSIASVDWQALDTLENWDRKRSILLKGNSQLGKTRAAYRLLAREYIEHDRGFLALDEAEIMAAVSDAFTERKQSELLKFWCSVDLLFFDDLDKVPMAQGVTGANARTLIFGAIKKRTANHKPTIISINLPLGDVFASGGPAMVASVAERVNQERLWQLVPFSVNTESTRAVGVG